MFLESEQLPSHAPDPRALQPVGCRWNHAIDGNWVDRPFSGRSIAEHGHPRR